jgi:hypothetical protein
MISTENLPRQRIAPQRFTQTSSSNRAPGPPHLGYPKHQGWDRRGRLLDPGLSFKAQGEQKLGSSSEPDQREPSFLVHWKGTQDIRAQPPPRLDPNHSEPELSLDPASNGAEASSVLPSKLHRLSSWIETRASWVWRENVGVCPCVGTRDGGWQRRVCGG